MRPWHAVLASALALGLAGCAGQPVQEQPQSPANFSPAPVPINQPMSFQRKLQSADHWWAVASILASAVADTIRSTPELVKLPVYVEPPQESIPFNLSLRELIATRLFEKGIAVSTVPADALTVSVKTMLVQANHARDFTPPCLAASGCEGGRTWPSEESEIAWDTIPRGELLVTTTIKQGGRFVFRRSDIYYVGDGDAAWYLTSMTRKPPPNRLIDVVREYEWRRAQDARLRELPD